MFCCCSVSFLWKKKGWRYRVTADIVTFERADPYWSMGVLAANSAALSAAAAATQLGRSAQCETGPVLCVVLFHGLGYQILWWTPALPPHPTSPPCSSQLTPQLSVLTNLSPCRYDPVLLSSCPVSQLVFISSTVHPLSLILCWHLAGGNSNRGFH